MGLLLSRRALLAALSGAALGVHGRAARALSKEDRMEQAAQAFLASLDAARRARAAFAFGSEERFDWHYVPRRRRGLPLGEMTPDQRRAALRLLEASLSADGFARVETIRTLEAVLHEVEQGRGPLREPENYAVSLFGLPGTTSAWGWRFEGHHVSLHWTMQNGSVVASTPQFLGSNPAEVRHGPLAGTSVLRREEDLGRKLAASLSPEQRAAGIAAAVAPPDILTTNQRPAPRLPDAGVAYRELRAEQQALLVSAIRQHASAQREEVARARLNRIRGAGMDGVHFAWMGGLEPGQGHYYRIQGPTFLIELDNTQDGANHVHTAWRDFEGDWGLDLLARHLREEHGR